MRLTKKPLWLEGMMLSQQQFQQNERYIESQINYIRELQSSVGWGMFNLEIDTSYFTQNKLGIRIASGIFPDGTVFNIGENAIVPKFIELASTVLHKTIYLGIPVIKHNEPTVGLANCDKAIFRYLNKPETVLCYTNHDQGEAVVDSGILQVSLLSDNDDLEQYSVIPIARIDSVDNEVGIKLDKEFIPTMLRCSENHNLARIVNEIDSLLEHRATTLIDRVQPQSNNHIADISEFLLLQLVNRAKMIFSHLKRRQDLHPRTLFAESISLYGELSTLCSPTKRPVDEFIYQHHDLTSSFLPLINCLRQLLQLVIEQNAVQIGLAKTGNSIYQANINDQSLLNDADFILAVKADLETKTLSANIPAQIKIGPLTNIHTLVNAQIPGVDLKELNIVPPQIQYYAGFSYFKLNDKHELWRQIQECKGIALHVGGDFPGLELACWAIRRI